QNAWNDRRGEPRRPRHGLYHHLPVRIRGFDVTPSSRPPSPTTRGWRLQTKLIVSMLLVGVVPLLVGLGMAFWQGSKEIQEVSGESFKALATEAARKLDILVGEEIARTSRIAADPLIVRELERRRDLALNADGKSSTAVKELQSKW